MTTFNNAVKYVLRKENGTLPTQGTIYAIDGTRIDVKVTGSALILRNIPIIGDVTQLVPGQTVTLTWQGTQATAVALPGSSGSSSVSFSVDNDTLENSSSGLRVRHGGIRPVHLSFEPSMVGHTHPGMGIDGLPIASADTLGVIRVGGYLYIDPVTGILYGNRAPHEIYDGNNKIDLGQTNYLVFQGAGVSVDDEEYDMNGTPVSSTVVTISGGGGEEGEGLPGSLSFYYTYCTDLTDTDPGVSYFSFDNTDLAQVTRMNVNFQDILGRHVGFFLYLAALETTYAASVLLLQSKADPTNWATLVISGVNNVTGNPIDPAAEGYLSLGVSLFVSSGTFNTNSGDVLISAVIIPSGNPVPHALFSTTHSDVASAASPVCGDMIIGNSTPAWDKLAISVPGSNVLNVLGVANGETRPSWKALFDATNPAALGAASPGTSLIAAHRDHVHAIPSLDLTVSAPIALSGHALSLVNNAGSPATVTAIDVGALANSDTVVPTSKAVKTAISGFGTGNISGTGVVGQVAEFVTDAHTVQAAHLIAPTSYILTITDTAASTLALAISSGKTLTFTATDNFNLTIPATGTAALLGTANVFTTQQMVDGTSDQIQLRVQGHSTQTARLQTWEDSAGAVLSSVSGQGYLGIGIAPATDRLIKTSKTDVSTSGYPYTIELYGIHNPPTDSTTKIYTLFTNMIGQGSAHLTTIGCFLNQVYNDNTNLTDYAFALNNQVANRSTGTLSFAYGQSLQITNTGGGTITNAYGEVITVSASTGTITTARSLSASVPSISGTGSIGTAYGIRVDGASIAGSGTLGNAYAIYVANISGAGVNYAIYTNAGDIRLMGSASDKMGLWGKTPVAEPTTAISAATFVANSSGLANDTATFDGYTLGQVVKALRTIGILA